MAGKVPPNSGNPFADIVDIMKILRSPGGCPWDMKQTLDTAVEDLLGEAEEVREAIEKGDMDNLREELGDLLWSILFTANIAREKHLFDIGDILREARAKIIRRHPHVFGDASADSPDEAMWHFQEAKKREKDAIHKG
jgi:uncharacterized protein YabN with tetrapyrrole methylase and pyrophosphatase domain